MPSDRSRRTDDLRDGYKEVVAQQGRVILDRDFNALQGLTDERIAANALDMVGPCGTPDDGFAISLPQLSPPSPPLWSSPGGFGPAGPQDFDFLISPGTMYVGGQRAVLVGRQAGQAITYSYYDQPDWIDPPDPVTFESPPGGDELVYLDLVEQEVSAAEDPDLLEVALGGPDTTARIKLMRQVRRLAVSSFDCAEAWQDAATHWLDKGLQIDPRTMRLEPSVRLQVGFTQDVTATDPCDPVATGGYLGADNQLIRVQIGHSGSLGPGGESAQLLWGYDNASFIYRVTSVSPDGTMLTLASNPPDAFHIPQTGQLVEILLTEAVLGKEPDETDPTGQRSILRVVAAANGELRRLTQPYGPITPGDPTNYIVLDQPLEWDFISSPTPLFLRVWQAELSFDPAGDTLPLNDPASGATTGVQVTISVPPGEIATRGAFWLLAVRPTTPQAVYPERLLTEPQPPDGPRRWVCPLAVIDWQSGSVTDCRCKFDNLVELTKRPRSCCTVSVLPEDLTATNTLQSIIDRAAGQAQVVTVCLSPGTYQLSQPLSLTSMHSNMVIEACGGAVSIQATNPEFGPFVDGLVVISEANNIVLRGLQFQLPATPFEALIIMNGVNVGASQNLSVERCSFAFAVPAVLLSPPANISAMVGAAIFLRGDCSGLTVQGCNFDSSLVPTNSLLNRDFLTEIAAAMPFSAPLIRDLLPTSAAAPSSTVGGSVRWNTLRERIARASATSGAVPPFVVTVGCLAGPAVAPTQPVIDGMLGDVCLGGNSFDSLTWAVFSYAYAQTARVRDNNVTRCVAGIWLWSPDSLPSTNPLYQQVTSEISNAELFLVAEFIFSLPWPALGVLSPPTDTAATVYSLFFMSNQVEARPTNAVSSAALVIFANRPVPTRATPSISLTISGNRLQNADNRNVPTAVIVLPDGQQRSVVTGNLIFNEAFVNGDTPSLYILLNSTNLVQLLAVVGNSLLGDTNLGALPRSSVATDTWVPYNSIL
jgi:Family of unknown function (DUF6519)